MSTISTRVGGDKIDYEDEDPNIGGVYEEECRDNSVKYGMARFFD